VATYPAGTYAPTPVANGGVIDAARDNAQDGEITAVENALLNGLDHALTISTGGLTISTGGLRVSGPSTFTGAVTFSSLVSAVAQPRCLVYSTVAQSFAANAFTAVSFTAEEYDVGGLHSTAANPSRITIPAGSSGLYLFGTLVRFSTGGAGDQAFVRMIKNSTTEFSAGPALARASSASITLQYQVPAVVDGGDFFEVEVFPTTSTGSMAAAGVRRIASDFWCVKLW